MFGVLQVKVWRPVNFVQIETVQVSRMLYTNQPGYEASHASVSLAVQILIGQFSHSAGVEDGCSVSRHPEGGDEEEVYQVTQEQGDDNKEEDPCNDTLQALWSVE